MSSRRKGRRKAQAFRYDPESTRVNNPPVLRWVSQSKRPFGEVESEGPSSRKRIKGKGREDDGMLLEALHNEMQRRLETKIRNVLNNDGDLRHLKETLLKSTRLEKGVVTGAESSHGFAAGSIERYIKRNRATKKNHQYWVDRVQDAFDSTVENMRAQLATPTASEPHTPVAEAQGSIVEQQSNQEQRRTFTMAMRQIIRKDLKPDIKDHFIKTLNEAIKNVTDYISCYSFKVYSTFLLMLNYAFLIDDAGAISLRESRVPILVLKDEKCTVDNYLMKKAYSMYFVNFKNIWTRPGRFRKILNQLLSHLLRIHLAPERTKQYKHYLSQSKQDRQKTKKTQNHVYLPAIPFSSIGLINNSRSHRRNLFKKERNKLETMLKRYKESNFQDEKWKTRADRCQRSAFSKGKLKQQEKPNLIDDDDNELLDLMNLAEELPAAEGRILELEDNATQDNNDTPEEE
ncbi:hypothetical protein BD560DRAFT_477463 [Blakeslea trispora]|nr:hypothetical protein BD560DRAFT_477463 [Blakeslea trispora]